MSIGRELINSSSSLSSMPIVGTDDFYAFMPTFYLRIFLKHFLVMDTNSLLAISELRSYKPFSNWLLVGLTRLGLLSWSELFSGLVHNLERYLIKLKKRGY